MPNTCSFPSRLQAVYELLWGILQGINKLHMNNIIHGAVNPGNIFVTNKGSSILAEFDFSKSPVSCNRQSCFKYRIEPNRIEQFMIELISFCRS
jgi:serine/threonine protein kinase